MVVIFQAVQADLIGGTQVGGEPFDHRGVGIHNDFIGFGKLHILSPLSERTVCNACFSVFRTTISWSQKIGNEINAPQETKIFYIDINIFHSI